MAQTAEQIKTQITDYFMANPNAQQAWGFSSEDEFDRWFSTVSVEDIIFSISSLSMADLQSLMDAQKTELNDLVSAQKAHTSRWYRQMVLKFMKDMLLVPDKDYYDTTGMSEAQIRDAKVLKYSAVVSTANSSEITIKIAGETNGAKAPLDEPTETQVTAYLAQVKDAGVRIRLVNELPEQLYFSAKIWYDALLTPSAIDSAVRSAVQNYINNLPFNGEYTNMALVDAIQQVAGVEVVELDWAQAYNSLGVLITDIAARYTPYSGYFNIGTVTLDLQPYEL